MARSVTEIFNAIFADKNSRPELDSLNSTSATSIWRNWAYNAAVAQQNLEIIQDRFADEVNIKLASNIVGTPKWYQEKAFEFQLGYDLSLAGYSYGYAVDDPSSEIIEACSVFEDTGSTLLIKVAKADASTAQLEALSTLERTQFSKYVTKIKLAGTKINVVSLAADQLVMSGCTVYYDSIYAASVIQANVELALTQYTKSIPFDGSIKTSTVVDVIQGVEGVLDVVLNHLAIKSGSDINAVDRVATLPAGYINEADAPYSFNDLIIYVGV